MTYFIIAYILFWAALFLFILHLALRQRSLERKLLNINKNLQKIMEGKDK